MRVVWLVWMEDVKVVESLLLSEVVEARLEDWMYSWGRGCHELFEALFWQS